MPEARKILGNFEILERIGQGGMGTVFKARQITMDRIVALKVLPPRLAKEQNFIERFLREARASARLNHPNVVNGIDVGQVNGLYYFAMEFVSGQSLKEAIRQGPLSEERTVEIGKAMASALVHAHSHGIIHRDIKPDNILLEANGTPKLCDLGLARLETDSDTEKNLTLTGQAVGTPHYISPEQAQGADDLDAKTDLYSLGATLYHAATGSTMYEGLTSAVVMTKHITEKAVAPNKLGVHLSAAFIQVLAKLLVKGREDRYESAKALLEDLDRLSQKKAPLHAELSASKWPFDGDLQRQSPRKPGVSATQGFRSRVSRREPAVRRGASLILAASLAGLILAGAGGYFYLFKMKPGIVPLPIVSPKPVPSASPVASLAVAETKAADLPANAHTQDKLIAPAHKPETPRIAEAKSPATVPAEDVKKAEGDKLAAENSPPAENASVPVNPSKESPQPTAVIEKPVQAKTSPGEEAVALTGKALNFAKETKYSEAANVFKLPADTLQKFDGFDQEYLRLHIESYAGLSELKPAIMNRLKMEPGKVDTEAFIKRKLGGKLAGADERSLFIRDQNVDLPYPWQRLSLEETMLLCTQVLGRVPPKIVLGLGVLAFDRAEDALARQILSEIKTQPDARKMLEFIDARDQALIERKKAQLSAEAEKVFTELETAMSEADFKSAIAKAALLRGKYAETDFVRTKAAEIDLLIETARAAVETSAAVEKGNVALAINGAKAVAGSNPENLIDGITTGYTGATGFAMGGWPCEMVVTLPKVYLLREIRALLWDQEAERFYRYTIETSVDGQKYTPLVDHSKGQWRSWQTAQFSPRPVKCIKVKGLYNSANGGFHMVELEAYCIPPIEPAHPNGLPRPKMRKPDP